MVWFNQITFCHWSYLSTNSGVMRDLKDKPVTKFPLTTLYGDGTEIEPEVIRHIREVQWECTRAEQLQKGDVLIMDNMLAAHSKLGHSGVRVNRVALATYSEDDLSAYAAKGTI